MYMYITGVHNGVDHWQSVTSVCSKCTIPHCVCWSNGVKCRCVMTMIPCVMIYEITTMYNDITCMDQGWIHVQPDLQIDWHSVNSQIVWCNHGTCTVGVYMYIIIMYVHVYYYYIHACTCTDVYNFLELSDFCLYLYSVVSTLFWCTCNLVQ